MRVLVVGNPCNTNCLIARSNAPEVPDERWFAMTRLDQNRAVAQLAEKAGVPVGEVKNVAIWGNHSSTQFPDFENATIGGQKATEAIRDDAWLRGEFITTVQKRGAAVIEARGLQLSRLGRECRDRHGREPPRPRRRPTTAPRLPSRATASTERPRG